MKPILDVNRLIEVREAKGWSKNRSAQELGILQSVYSRYESGESAPSYSVIKNMALTFGTSVDYLTGRWDDKTPTEFIVSCKDHQLSFIIDKYNSSSADDRARLYEYAKKLNSSTKKK